MFKKIIAIAMMLIMCLTMAAFAEETDKDARIAELEAEREALAGLRTSEVPVILAVNKIDTVPKLQLLPVIDKLKDLYDFSDIVPISAQEGKNLNELFEKLSVAESRDFFQKKLFFQFVFLAFRV